jgi:hypothetical protein
MRKKRRLLIALTISSALFLIGSLSFADDVNRMTKEELKAMLDSPDLTLIDVRLGKDWAASEVKIKGALREDPQTLDAWAAEYDKEKTVVLYCG